MTPPAERAPLLDAVPGLLHRFYGRGGGTSRDRFASLNLSTRVGDEPASVDRNWECVRADLDAPSIAHMNQVHGNEVAVVDPDHVDVGAADGLMTAHAGLALPVLTADCVPILMAAPRQRAAMALHAGWRGTASGIAAAAIERGRDLWRIPAADWLVALGPAIGPCCYDVGADVGETITARWGAMPDAWDREGAKGHLDLRLANRSILIRAGVPKAAISLVGTCTACAPERYFSHRRSRGRTGRQASVIAWSAGA